MYSLEQNYSRNGYEFWFCLKSVAVGCVVLVLASSAVCQKNTEETTWKRHSVEVRKLLLDEDIEGLSREHTEPYLIESATSGGFQVGLFDTGSVEASNSGVAVVLLLHGKPRLASFYERDGGIIPGKIFMRGSSVMYSDDVGLLQNGRALYTLHVESSGETDEAVVCKVKAYGWVSRTQSFHWSRKLTAETQAHVCRAGQKLASR